MFLKYVTVKVKVYVYSPDIPVGSADFTSITQVLEFTLSQSPLPGENAAPFSAAVAIRTVPIFVPLGTHYCCLPKDSTHNQRCGNRNPDPLILGLTP